MRRPRSHSLYESHTFPPYRLTEYNKRMRNLCSFLTEKKHINTEKLNNILSMEISTKKYEYIRC